MKNQDKYELTTGDGRTKINLVAYHMGNDLVVCIYNKNAHIGAIAVGEYDRREDRASCSVITRLGHKDDVIAQKAAYLVSKHIRRPSCAIVGVHIDDITEKEIQEALENTDSLVKDFLKQVIK